VKILGGMHHPSSREKGRNKNLQIWEPDGATERSPNHGKGETLKKEKTTKQQGKERRER